MAQPTPLKRVHGYLAEFGSAKDLYHAAEQVRDAGFSHWDVHSPFPIHGMDHAMGLPKSILSTFVLIGGTTGTLTAFLLQHITQVILYPTVVQSKPHNIFTIPAFFPVMFELTILFSAFTCLFGGLALMKLPRLHHPLFNSDNFKRFSDDGFFLCIEARDPKFSMEKTKAFLGEIGGTNLELVEDEI
ncbi:MAG: DUF3341 domain-containing protein [Verrucomicrobiales bacterium]|nr:DUF3341 domain-containing protein [Verrucomicrobiales bacterium]